MEKINVLIIEDSGLIAEDIASKLQKHHMNVVGVYASGEEALQSLEDAEPDVVLMDIELAGALDGISTAQIIKGKLDVPIVYLSSHVDQHLLERAKKTFPANYLSKPFHEGDLVRALEIAFTNWQAEERSSKSILRNHIFLKDGALLIKLAYDDIICLKADRAYCKIITEQNPTGYTESTNMRRVFDQLTHKDFIQVHRSYVINVNKITSIEGNIIRLGKHTVEMSTGMRENLMGKLKLLK